MTKTEILATKPGLELDALIAEIVMEWRRPTDPVLAVNEEWLRFFHPSTDISAAWRVVDRIHDELFSYRHFFLKALQEQTEHTLPETGEDLMIAWPDVFWFITPETICKAALLSRLRGENAE